jgi:hypothetical protein
VEWRVYCLCLMCVVCGVACSLLVFVVLCVVYGAACSLLVFVVYCVRSSMLTDCVCCVLCMERYVHCLCVLCIVYGAVCSLLVCVVYCVRSGMFTACVCCVLCTKRHVHCLCLLCVVYGAASQRTDHSLPILHTCLTKHFYILLNNCNLSVYCASQKT